jgi:hypothetical protein
VEGKGGDEGIDSFIGDFSGKIRVFQHKYFLDSLKSSQRRQIEASLHQVLAKHDVAAWTLMLPKDLTPAELRWFESVAAAHDDVEIDWWGRTKLIELLTQSPELAAAFQPARPITVLVFGKDATQSSATTENILSSLGYDNYQLFAPIVKHKLEAANRPPLRILVWGPGPSGGELYLKRVQIRDWLARLGHAAVFSEDTTSPRQLTAGGLNLTIEEFLQATSCDYIVCLMASPGAIGEVHDFAKRRKIACKMMVCVDANHRDGYSAKGALGIFEGFNGKLDWFKNPEDLTSCQLATRVVQQVEKTADAKHWELLESGKGL